MDKETLSNYGWIVICVLVIAVMVALATPFGNYVKSAVENTTQGLFDVEQKALVAGGLTIANQSFEGGSEPESPAEPEQGITDLTGTTWELCEYPEVISGGLAEGVWNINFVSNENTYSSLYTSDAFVFYDSTKVKALGPLSSLYRIVAITGGVDATNPDTIAWFEANATRIVE